MKKKTTTPKKSARAKRRRSVMDCGCVKKIDKGLASHNTAIEVGFTMNFTTGTQGDCLLIQTRKVDPKKRGRPRPLFACYCPFCGTKYDT